MKGRLLIYKATYENIRDILLEINKGIVCGISMLPYDQKYEIRDFNVNFRNILNETRKDITFFYKYKYSMEEPGFKIKITGYRLGTDIQKVDIISFFTKVKENKTEHRIYQIGRIYSSSSEILDDFKEKAKTHFRDSSDSSEES